jgi:2-polyprenyl-3-methyl-5-hydroxy-6-metoxy-1,4-benzoquinol methylase
METLNNCPVCKQDGTKPYLSCVDYTVSRETFAVVQCKSCGFRFTNPRPDEKEIGKYYQAEEYISHSDTSKGLVNKLYLMVRNYTIGKKVKLINRLSRPLSSATPHLLDIGCGTAEFIHACKQDGWNVTGIEPSEVARKNAEQKYGITPLPQEKLFELNEKKYNVISLWHVLEHVHELDRTIAQIHKLLLDEGVLIIAVPNCESPDAKNYGAHWAAWDVPRHLYHFTINDIKTLFSRSGFTLAEVLPMKFDSFYVSLLSEKYKTGRSNLLSGFFNGLNSNLSAGSSGYSSQIYILKKLN